MRITKNQIRQIIKEELAGVLREGFLDTAGDAIKAGGKYIKDTFTAAPDRSLDQIKFDTDANNAALKSGDIDFKEWQNKAAQNARDESSITGVAINPAQGNPSGIGGGLTKGSNLEENRPTRRRKVRKARRK
jgi:hypothetical protein